MKYSVIKTPGDTATSALENRRSPHCGSGSAVASWDCANAQEIGKTCGGNGLAEIKPLSGMAAMHLQEFQLLGGLHALRDGLEMQALGHGDDGDDDGGVVGVAADAAHERLVDLERVNREALEVG